MEIYSHSLMGKINFVLELNKELVRLPLAPDIWVLRSQYEMKDNNL